MPKVPTKRMRYVEVKPGSRRYRTLLSSYVVYRLIVPRGENEGRGLVYAALDASDIRELRERGIHVRDMEARDIRLKRQYGLRHVNGIRST